MMDDLVLVSVGNLMSWVRTSTPCSARRGVARQAYTQFQAPNPSPVPFQLLTPKRHDPPPRRIA